MYKYSVDLSLDISPTEEQKNCLMLKMTEAMTGILGPSKSGTFFIYSPKVESPDKHR